MRRAKDFREIDTLFDCALDLPEDEQAAFLERECARDPELKHEVQRLLDAHRRSAGFLESPAFELAAPLLESALAAEASTDWSNVRIGAFRIVREIGAGGMGAVVLAERDDGLFQQRVALKLVHQRGGGRELVQRFLEERRILALLEHPGIARLVDGGITSDGQPYFAMEFVEGEAIDRYCDTHHLPITERIRLFQSVCDAVQYAHQHLVIHRDLKPSNILITADGQVKLLDFGIAKLLDPLAATTDAPLTRTGVLPMTPEYAAPEQVRGEPVSTATDVYALGILLYTLLAGRRPYDLRGRSAAEIERIVCEVEPPRPSTNSDLAVIVMKALHKDSRRRYATVAALQEDLRRFETGLPVQARADSAGYRFGKFVRRNRTVVAAASITLIALLAATAFSTAQMRVAQRQRDEAVRDAKRQEALSEVQAVLASDSRGPDGRALSPAERVELAERVLMRKFRGEPWLVAETMVNLANTLYDTGDRLAQRRLLARAGGLARAAGMPTQVALANCLRAYSFAFDDQLDSARADMTEARAALARQPEYSVVTDAVCLDAEAQLVAATQPDSSVALLRRAVAIAQASGDETITRQMANDFANALRAIGQTREASVYYRRNLESLERAGYAGTEVVPNIMSFLTSALFELGEVATADSVVQATIEHHESIHGAGSAGSTLTFLHGLSKLRLGEIDSADIWFARALRDTTQGAGGLRGWLPPALAQLRLEQHRLADARSAIAELPTGTLTRSANAAWFNAWLRREEGDARGALAQLATALQTLLRDRPKPPPPLAPSLVVAAEWSLEAQNPHAADSLALLARAAAAPDSLALERSAYAGRAELVRARALLQLGQPAAARAAAARAVTALAHGYGPTNPRTRAAQAFRDSIPR